MNEKVIAPIGLQTMSPAMGEMQSYPHYLFEKLKLALGHRILEIGVGHGNYTGWLLEAGEVLAVDIDSECLEELRRRYPHPNLQTAVVDLNDVQSLDACKHFRPDTIVCVNVLEHIERDVHALQSLFAAAAPGAKLGLIVPAHPFLLGQMDREAGHFRRYTRAVLSDVLAQSGWETVSLRYINAIGALGWWYHNRFRTDAGLSDRSVNWQMRKIDGLLPRLARLTDPLLQRFFGLSLVAIARRPVFANAEYER
jgi:SAM-dependent methyltransferase